MKKAEIKSLIFVYNARSGMVNALIDSAHKLLKPETYSCHLCDITYGLTGEKKKWKAFRKQHTIPMKFLHKDEFLSGYASKWVPKYTYPIVLAETDEDLEIFISTSNLNAMRDTEELIEYVIAHTQSQAGQG